MNESPTEENTTPSSESQPTAGAIAGIERTFLRLTFWQTILSVAGVFTGAVALYAALNESQAVREQTAASVWPYVQLIISDTSDDDSASFEFSLNNVGVGPARMQGAVVTLNGRAMPDWQSVTDAILPSGARLGIDYGKSSVAQRVLAPGESLVAFQTQNRELALGIQAAAFSGALSLTYCYCSIFDNCWIKSSESEGSGQPNEAVAQCPKLGADRFQD
ncbi:MAG: hypothetical protein AAGI24_07300 [Pseudomonadota bacterium]